MSAPADVALADQLAAVAREVATEDMARFLLPEGVDHTSYVTPGDQIGPVTQAFLAWIEVNPKEAACAAGRATPLPLFATVESPLVFCAACFADVASVYARSIENVCSVCRLDAAEVRPVTMTIGIFNVLAVVCTECTMAEHRAGIETRYRRIAGSRPTACEGGEA